VVSQQDDPASRRHTLWRSAIASQLLKLNLQSFTEQNGGGRSEHDLVCIARCLMSIII